MTLKWLLGKIDKTLCCYFGLDREEIRPTKVRLTANGLMITNTSSYKRHVLQEPWDNFSSLSMEQTSIENREKLGLAVGKAIAKNLVISFDKTSIKRT